MTAELDERPATSIEALDLHLRYMRQEMRNMRDGMKELTDTMKTMATQSDVQALGRRIDALENRVDQHKPESPFWRAVNQITKLGAAATVVLALIAGFATAVHFWDKFEAVTAAARAGK